MKEVKISHEIHPLYRHLSYKVIGKFIYTYTSPLSRATLITINWPFGHLGRKGKTYEVLDKDGTHQFRSKRDAEDHIFRRLLDARQNEKRVRKSIRKRRGH